MLKHFLTIALRNLWRKRFHSAINIGGLAIGISACMVIYLIIQFELSFNKKMADADRIYRIHSSFEGTFSGLNRGAPTAIAPYMRENFKGLERVSLFHILRSRVQRPTPTGNQELDKQCKGVIAGPDFFDTFASYEWLYGSPQQSLTMPFQVVLTRTKAAAYFGNLPFEEIIGKELIYRDSLRTHVSGIVADLPFNSDLEMTDFISFATIESSWLKNNFRNDSWTSTNSSTQVFVKTLPAATAQDIRDQLPLLSAEYKSNSRWDAENKFRVQPFSDLHYNANTGIFDFSRDAAHMPTLLTIGVVAVLLLLIGAINFVNLETALAIRRAKEVGVRKVLGSERGRLMRQFIFESSLVTLMALALALPLTEGALIYFQEFVPPGVVLRLVEAIPFLLAVLVVVGVLAGAYPAFVLSSVKPVWALKNVGYSPLGQSRSSILRKSLMVFQFTVAQVLIIGALVVTTQIQFMLGKDLGFEKDEVIYLDAPWWDKPDKVAALKARLVRLSAIQDISMSAAPPAENGWSSSTLTYKGPAGEVNVNTYRKSGDPNYIPFYGMQLVAGRNITASDTVKEIVVNETLVRALGFKTNEEALGQSVTYGSGAIPIVGVVSDFHFRSLHQAIEPVMIGCEQSFFSCFNVRLHSRGEKSEVIKKALADIEREWKEVYPDTPFEYHFLDDTVRGFYASEQRMSKLVDTAMMMAILISFLGLFGLASFATAQRTKEIGVRKVLGATVQQLMLLLTREFLIYVAVAFVVAAPMAWLAASYWLDGFAYRTPLGSWMFVVTLVASGLLAFVTVGLKTLRTANANPVESLRAE
ncbi:MAG: ABC transporter permease [Cyclobacteriaceae bacterium]|jgi:hypothetical protein|nr:ABC transporter permease [Cyclobacteriaceae bacterium]